MNLSLSKEQADALGEVIEEYITNEPEILNDAFNSEMTAYEVRYRCERWNHIITIGGWNRMQARYTEDDIQALIKNLKWFKEK